MWNIEFVHIFVDDNDGGSLDAAHSQHFLKDKKCTWATRTRQERKNETWCKWKQKRHTTFRNASFETTTKELMEKDEWEKWEQRPKKKEKVRKMRHFSFLCRAVFFPRDRVYSSVGMCVLLPCVSTDTNRERNKIQVVGQSIKRMNDKNHSSTTHIVNRKGMPRLLFAAHISWFCMKQKLFIVVDASALILRFFSFKFQVSSI